MSLKSAGYHLLGNEGNEDNEDDEHQNSKQAAGRRPFRNARSNIKTVLLALSCIANVGFVTKELTRPPVVCLETSKYAGLQYDVLKPFHHTSPYSSTNLTLAQEYWDTINFDAGMIYITDDMVESLGLPPAQPFPWDNSHSIYLLNGHHNLHCLQSIEFGLMDYHHGRQPAYPIEHILHCLDALRDDVICHADDTPRYTTSTETPESGVGQLRQCRDWGKLEAWAEKYSGCWRYVDESWDHESELLRWQFCPPKSPGYLAMQKYLKGHETGTGA